MRVVFFASRQQQETNNVVCVALHCNYPTLYVLLKHGCHLTFLTMSFRFVATSWLDWAGIEMAEELHCIQVNKKSYEF